MDGITYQWKVDFALILSFFVLLFTLVRWFIEHKEKKKNKILEAYEKVFDDAIYILLHPLRYKKEITNKKEFTHDDPEFEKAVRNYLSSHFHNRSVGNIEKFIPNNIIDQIEQLKYLHKVAKAANEFKSEISNEQLSLDISSLSPVNYFDNDEINLRFQRIIDNIGKNLSLFSENAQIYWSDILTSDPIEVKNEYHKSLEVCPNYFRHNSRDFADPYLDLLQNIRDDYRKLTKKKFEYFGWKTRLLFNKTFRSIKTYITNKNKV